MLRLRSWFMSLWLLWKRPRETRDLSWFEREEGWWS